MLVWQLTVLAVCLQVIMHPGDLAKGLSPFAKWLVSMTISQESEVESLAGSSESCHSRL